jgi:uncharacterized protein (TIGR00255 family)
MPCSMTGFASHETTADSLRITWEVRSVNHRFLDVSVRLPEELRALEPRCREIVGATVRRGKVDCSLRLAAGDGGGAGAVLEETALAELKLLTELVAKHFPEARPLTAAEILRWPGVMAVPRQEASALEAPVAACLGAAVASLQTERTREGGRIVEFLRARNASILAHIESIRPRLADVQERNREKLRERLARLKVEIVAERFEQEVGLVVQRLDLEEEIDRLLGHVGEVSRLLGDREPVGRRLDFIAQELNREANTFASKAQDEELARHAVDVKVLIEQMREQIQNLE